jgi:hypothetical protein
MVNLFGDTLNEAFRDKEEVFVLDFGELVEQGSSISYLFGI